MPDVQRYADTVMAKIRDDIAAGLVSAEVSSFSDLHDHVDANEYVHDAGVPWGAGDAGTYDTVNAVMAEVDRRLASGEHRHGAGAER